MRPLFRAARPAPLGPRRTPTHRLPALGIAIGIVFLVVLSLGLSAGASHAQSGIARSERPEGAELYFISPQAGATLSSPLTVRFGLSEMGVAPAGVEKPHTGHHHLIVDAELPPTDLPIPKNEQYRHFGAGQTQVELELTPGTHTLQLLLGDHNHVPHDPPVVSERITITVE